MRSLIAFPLGRPVGRVNVRPTGPVWHTAGWTRSGLADVMSRKDQIAIRSMLYHTQAGERRRHVAGRKLRLLAERPSITITLHAPEVHHARSHTSPHRHARHSCHSVRLACARSF